MIEREIRVLLLGAGGNVSQGILKAIRNSGLGVYVVGACVSYKSAGLYLCDEKLISPYAKEACFMQWLVRTCNEYQIDIVMTGVEENILAIARRRAEFSAGTKAVFVSSSTDKLEIGKDKYRTCMWLEEHGCNFPCFCLPEDREGVAEFLKNTHFPIIAKPRYGKGSDGVLELNSQEEIGSLAGKGYLLEEYIGTPDSEYTVGCYCDKEGELHTPIVMHRRLKNGSTCWAEVILLGEKHYSEIVCEVEKICREFRPTGPLNIQLRMDREDRAVCFELNVRFSGTTAVRDRFGFCDVRAMLKEYILCQPISDCFHIMGGEMYRLEDELYLPAHATEDFRRGVV